MKEFEDWLFREELITDSFVTKHLWNHLCIKTINKLKLQWTCHAVMLLVANGLIFIKEIYQACKSMKFPSTKFQTGELPF